MIALSIGIGSYLGGCAVPFGGGDDGDAEPVALPDAVLDATVTGAWTATHSFTLLGQQQSGGHTVRASFNGSTDLFRLGGGNDTSLFISFSGPTGGLAVGDYTILDAGYIYSTMFGGPLTENASGTFSITKVVTLSGDVSYVDGRFNYTVESTETPPRTVTVDGSFQGVATSSTP